MNKQEFLNRLAEELCGVPQSEAAKTLDYYSEMIDDVLEDGGVEETVIARLGDVKEIAEKVINETPISIFVKEKIKERRISAAAVVLIIIGSPVWLPLLTAVFAVLFSLYLTAWSVVASLFAVFAAVTLSGSAMLILSPFMLTNSAIKALMLFSSSLICAGAAILLFYISVLSAKILCRFTMYIARKIKNMFMRKGGGQQ